MNDSGHISLRLLRVYMRRYASVENFFRITNEINPFKNSLVQLLKMSARKCNAINNFETTKAEMNDYDDGSIELLRILCSESTIIEYL